MEVKLSYSHPLLSCSNRTPFVLGFPDGSGVGPPINPEEY